MTLRAITAGKRTALGHTRCFMQRSSSLEAFFSLETMLASFLLRETGLLLFFRLRLRLLDRKRDLALRIDGDDLHLHRILHLEILSHIAHVFIGDF